MKIILLGAPGAGKGTLAERINKGLNLTHISTGDMFRRNMKEGTPVGMKAKSYIDKGMLVPDEVTVELVKVTLEETPDNFMLDGFPRTIYQAEQLDTITDIDIALNIEADFDIIISRLSGRRSCVDCGHTTHIKMANGNNCPKCGSGLVQRPDDREDVIKNRLEVYSNETAPLIDYYEKQGKLVSINGLGTPDEVWARAQKVLVK